MNTAYYTSDIPQQSFKTINCIYLVMDLRNSCDINDYLLKKNPSSVVKFYHEFRKVCDNIAVKKYHAWFAQQIGDRMDYAWTANCITNSYLCAIELYETLSESCFITLGKKIDLGIGLARGNVVYNGLDQVIGDAPRIATLLQEHRKGIYFLSDLPEQTNHILYSKNWTPIKTSFFLRDQLHRGYRLIPIQKECPELSTQNTRAFLESINGLAQDNHLHIEGVNMVSMESQDIILQAMSKLSKSKTKRKIFENVISKDIRKLKAEYRLMCKKGEEGKLKIMSFNELLSKLFFAKCALAESPKSCETYLTYFLERQVQHYPALTFGITPSIPDDFPYLNKSKWYNSIISTIEKIINKTVYKPTIVIETKRKHLIPNKKQTPIYLSNLDFLELLKKHFDDKINFAIGIADDEENYPVVNYIYTKAYKDYIKRAIEIDPDIQIQVHELEYLPSPGIESQEIKPTKEVFFILNFLDKLKQYGTTWISMCHLNKDGKAVTRTVQKEILNRIMSRGDRIITCFSSDRMLGRPFLLDDPCILKLAIQGKLNVSIGTNNPWPFRIRSLSDELNLVTEHLYHYYIEGLDISRDVHLTPEEVSLLSKFVLQRNSWLKWSPKDQKWIEPNIDYICKKMLIESAPFKEYFLYDLVPEISYLTNSNIIKKAISILKDRELR